MEFQFSWFAMVNALAGLVNLGLLWRVRRHRADPGGQWLIWVISAHVAACFLYATAVVVFNPLWLRHLLEAAVWASGVFLVAGWLRFSLRYTGRGDLIRTPLTIGFLIGAAGIVLLLLTDPVHGLVFSDLQLAPQFGAATVTFDIGPGFIPVLVVLYVCTAAGLLLLLETFLSDWPLFRNQTIALLLAPVPPLLGSVVYVFDLGPLPNVNLMLIGYIPTAALYVYAFYGGDLMELKPVTRRLGNTAALENLGEPVATVDNSGRIISLNNAATDLFGASERTAFATPVSNYLATSPKLNSGTTMLKLILNGRRKQYRVVVESFDDSSGVCLGYTLRFQNVTDIIQRERRLTVLNRALRHNLRNDLDVVTAHADRLADAVEGDLADSAETIAETGYELMAVSNRARELDRVIEETNNDEILKLRLLVTDIFENLRVEFPEATLMIDLDNDVQLRGDRETLRVVFENLLRNGVEHHDGAEPQVTVRQVDSPADRGINDRQQGSSEGIEGNAEDGTSVWVEVVDNGAGIPQSEIDVLSSGTETPLKHGSGLGLWVIQSGIIALGGDISFASSETGTTVTLRIPGVVSN